MANEQISEPFQIAFNMIRLPYAKLDEILTYERFVLPTDKVNVFINVETVMKYIASIPDIESVLINDKSYAPRLLREFINTVAHYRGFLKRNGINDVRVILYMTSLDSRNFKQRTYNESFRSYYVNKYKKNPRYAYMTECLERDVFPMLKTILEFVKGSHFIIGDGIDGSLIPMIVQSADPSYKSVIITILRGLHRSQLL